MPYGFAEIEAGLAIIHDIASEKRTAFVGRLKYLQKQGFLPNANTGRGKAASYQAEDAMLLGLALQLCEFGLSPDKAVNVIKRSMGYIAEGVLQATVPNPYEARSRLLCFSPTSNLEELHASQESDYGLHFLFLDDWLEGMRIPDKDPAMLIRYGFFSFTGLLVFLPAMMRRRDFDHEKEFWADLRRWAWPIVADHRRGLFPKAEGEADYG